MFKEAAIAIKKAKTILVTYHFNPDGDAVGSGVAMSRALKTLGKTVICYSKDPTPFNYRFLASDGLITSELPAAGVDATIVLDASNLGRAIPADYPNEKLGFIINIDHHLTSENFGAINIIDPKAAATGMLVVKALDELGVPLNKEIATAIYTAILTDTGSFQYSNTAPDTMEMASRLLAAGVSPRAVAEKVYESVPRARLIYLGRCLERMEIAPHGLWAAVQTELKELKELGVTKDMLDGFINYPRSIAGGEVAIMYREEAENRWKVSFRSRGNVNVAQMAAHFGGGGHFNAAGGTIEAPLPEVKTKVIAAIEEELKALGIM
jgi:phosphoesterase RecJ-like protein